MPPNDIHTGREGVNGRRDLEYHRMPRTPWPRRNGVIRVPVRRQTGTFGGVVVTETVDHAREKRRKGNASRHAKVALRLLSRSETLPLCSTARFARMQC